MATEQLLLLLVGALALLALLLGLWLLLVSQRHGKELQRLGQQLTAPGSPPSRETKVALETAPGTPPSSTTGERFSTQLNAVERRQTPAAEVSRNPAEKYGYVAALAEQGMSAVQIADALRMAPAEVAQLLRLASLKPGS